MPPLTMPVGNVLVRDTRCHIKHDNPALSVDVVPIPETTKLLLPGSVPYVELDRTKVLRKINACPETLDLIKTKLTVVNPRG